MLKKNFPPNKKNRKKLKSLRAIIYDLLLVLRDFLTCHPWMKLRARKTMFLLQFCNETDFFRAILVFYGFAGFDRKLGHLMVDFDSFDNFHHLFKFGNSTWIQKLQWVKWLNPRTNPKRSGLIPRPINDSVFFLLLSLHSQTAQIFHIRRWLRQSTCWNRALTS